MRKKTSKQLLLPLEGKPQEAKESQANKTLGEFARLPDAHLIKSSGLSDHHLANLMLLTSKLAGHLDNGEPLTPTEIQAIKKAGGAA